MICIGCFGDQLERIKLPHFEDFIIEEEEGSGIQILVLLYCLLMNHMFRLFYCSAIYHSIVQVVMELFTEFRGRTTGKGLL